MRLLRLRLPIFKCDVSGLTAKFGFDFSIYAVAFTREFESERLPIYVRSDFGIDRNFDPGFPVVEGIVPEVFFKRSGNTFYWIDSFAMSQIAKWHTHKL